MAKKRTKKKTSYPKRLRKNFSRYSAVKKAFLFVMAFAIVGVVLLIITYAHPSPYDDARQAHLAINPHRGLVYNGLRAVKVNADHLCKGVFEVEGVKPNGKVLCSHGPDPAPDNIDVTNPNANARVDELSQLPHTQTTPSQLQAQTTDQVSNYAATLSVSNSIPFAESPVPCTTGGYRIQPVIITHVADATKVVAALQSTARRMESELEYSSLHSGPGSTNRHFRFATNSACQLSVIKVMTPTGYSLDTFSSAVSYLSNHGYKDPHTKYLVWEYSGTANFCGAGTVYGDSQPSAANNAADQSTGYGIVGAQCFGTNAEMHELMHTLGAVENDAPHSTGGGHCLDEHDVMCYPDNPNTPCKRVNGTTYDCGYNGKPIVVVANCASKSLEFLLDCNDDDYFNSGNVSAGTYLSNHWNIAHSPYLQ